MTNHCNPSRRNYNINNISRIKDKDDIIISVDTERAFDKIQHSYVNSTQQTRNRGELPQPDKGVYGKPTLVRLKTLP